MKTTEEIAAAFEQFKNLNDQRLAEIEKSGSASAEAVEAANKANTAITELQNKLEAEREASNKRIDELEDRLDRSKSGGSGGRISDEKREFYAAWQTEVQGKDELIDPSDVDLEFVGNYKRDFRQYLRTGKPTNEMQVGSDQDGGYWVDADMSGRLVEFIYEMSPIRALATAQPVSGDALEGDLDLGEAGSGWVGEMETRTGTTTPQVFEYRISLMEQYAEPRATQRVIDFARRDVGAWLEGKVRRKLARDEATAFVSGTGVKQPRGFLTYADGVPAATVDGWPVVEQIPSGDANTLTADGLIALVYSLASEFLPGAVLGMRRATEQIVRTFKNGSGDYMWQPDFTERRQGRVVGLPIEDLPDMPAVTAGALAIVCANFAEAYQIVDSPIGVRVLRDNLTTKGKVKFYTTRYVGGDLINFEAIKLQDIAAS